MRNNCKTPGCTSLKRCSTCLQDVLKDGQSVRVPMTFMDSMQRDIAANSPNAIRAQALADHEAWKRQQAVNDQHADLSDAERAYIAQMQPYYDRVAAENAAAGARAVAAAGEAAQRLNGLVDGHTARATQRDAAARLDDHGYHEYCARLQYDPSRT